MLLLLLPLPLPLLLVVVVVLVMLVLLLCVNTLCVFLHGAFPFNRAALEKSHSVAELVDSPLSPMLVRFFASQLRCRVARSPYAAVGGANTPH